MASDYLRIRQDNLKEYGEGTAHLRLISRIYARRQHFVLELLQNAEDAKATQIEFAVFPDRLEVRHNGTVLFDEVHVRGICGVGEGTKADDLTQIGKFGVGFKSVYAYTSTPQVHSGDEHFCIQDYTRPSSVPAQDVGREWTTLFILPFDSPDVTPEVACEEITDYLRGFRPTDLLFLRSITALSWVTDGDQRGVVLRDPATSRSHGRQVVTLGPDDDDVQKWLVFERPVTTRDGGPLPPVEVAYRLASDEEHIACVNESPLVVFFPTEMETRLGLLVQGPYRTTPARDNIPPDDELNRDLMDATAQLVVETLRQLKEMGLLTVDTLRALPIREADFPQGGMFRPVFDAVRNALDSEPLLPAHKGGHVSARNALLARGGELTDLFSGGQLQMLLRTEHEPVWLPAEITENGNTRELWEYMQAVLSIPLLSGDDLAAKLSKGFLQAQPDEWIVRFYSCLTKWHSLWRAQPEGVLRRRPIIRLEDGSHVEPFDGSQPLAYLPTGGPTGFPTVKRTIAADPDALEFLQALGLGVPTSVDHLRERILPKYTMRLTDEITDEEHQTDLDTIERAYAALPPGSSAETELLDRLRRVPFLRAKNAANDAIVEYRCPDEMYGPGLCTYFEGNPDAWLLLHEEFRSGDDIRWSAIVSARVMPREEGTGAYATHARGIHEWGQPGFNPKFDVDGLKFALEHPNPDRAAYVWNKLLVPNSHRLRGEVVEATRANRSNATSYVTYSKAGRLAVDCAWIPSPEGGFVHPRDLTQLPSEFKADATLIEALGITQVAERNAEAAAQAASRRELEEHAQALGLDMDVVDMVTQDPEGAKLAIREFLSTRGRRHAQQAEQHPYPSQRGEKIREEVRPRRHETRLHRVRIDTARREARGELRERYTRDGTMQCQLCGAPMPFNKPAPDGRPYFVAVGLLDRIRDEHQALYLALCPTCAAWYRLYVKHDPQKCEALVAAIEECEGSDVPLEADDRQQYLTFHGKHLGDIKAVLSSLSRDQQDDEN